MYYRKQLPILATAVAVFLAPPAANATTWYVANVPPESPNCEMLSSVLQDLETPEDYLAMARALSDNTKISLDRTRSKSVHGSSPLLVYDIAGNDVVSGKWTDFGEVAFFTSFAACISIAPNMQPYHPQEPK